MKKRILSLITLVCMLLTSVLVTSVANAEITLDSSVTIISRLEGTSASPEKSGLTLNNAADAQEEKNSLGGKSADDGYIKLTTHETNQTFINLSDLADDTDKKYVVLTMSLYNESVSVVPILRYDSGKQPTAAGTTTQPNIDTYIGKDAFTKNVWNNLSVVYNTVDQKAYYVFNGAKSNIYDCTGEGQVPQLRVIFNTKKANIYFDDVVAYKTDAEPMIATVVSTAVNTGGITFNNATLSNEAADGIGGKLLTDTYIPVTTNANASTFVQIDSANNVDKKYFVLSLNIFGNKTNIVPKVRYNSGDPDITAGGISKTNMNGNYWNNVTLVYNTAEKKAYYYFNGTKSAEFDCAAYLQGRIDANITTVTLESLPTLRIVLNDKGVSTYFDDLIAYKTDVEPVVKYNALTGETGNINNSIAVCDILPADFSAQGGAMVSNDNGSTWLKAEASEGNLVAVETAVSDIHGIVLGKTYKYVKATGSDYSKELANTDTLTYELKGAPYTESGEKITDSSQVKKTYTNVFGSDLTMTFNGAGVNSTGNTQGIAKVQWENANNYPSRYLVVEGNIALAKEEGIYHPASGFGLTTNAGKALGSTISGLQYQNRINHYLWVYDVYNQTYDEYINDKQVSKGKALVEKAPDFVTGAATDIRLTFNGICKTNGGTDPDLYGGYLGNISIRECNTAPVANASDYIAGKELSTLKITNEKISVADLTAKLTGFDSVKVYADRDYSALAESDAYSGAGVVVTKKGNIYDYAKLVWAPSTDADYAIESLDIADDGSVYARLLNYGPERTLTPVLVRYKGSNEVENADVSTKTIKTDETIPVTLPKYAEESEIRFFVWDDMLSLTPLGDIIKIK